MRRLGEERPRCFLSLLLIAADIVVPLRRVFMRLIAWSLCITALIVLLVLKQSLDHLLLPRNKGHSSRDTDLNIQGLECKAGKGKLLPDASKQVLQCDTGAWPVPKYTQKYMIYVNWKCTIAITQNICILSPIVFSYLMKLLRQQWIMYEIHYKLLITILILTHLLLIHIIYNKFNMQCSM